MPSTLLLLHAEQQQNHTLELIAHCPLAFAEQELLPPFTARGYLVAMDRMATPADVDAICRGLPEVEPGDLLG
ncbi:hypothetical protein NG819_07685 [Pseudarthrobacter sp. Fe7]|nr:hypothetical protein NG819_07685 [Pseudarthrobacter sp. Fe7]